MADEWWDDFFDADYAALWAQVRDDARSDQEVDELTALVGLAPGQRVLDAPCGYGRIARRLAARGLVVVGLDRSAPLLAIAERERPAGVDLAYRRHDLRDPAPEAGFDVALNLFSSLGYGTEADDRAILANLVAALRPGGALVIETAHRDTVAVSQALGLAPATRRPDGTLMIEEPVFDPVAGIVESTWYWSGPTGGGHKRARLRVYTYTELCALVTSAGARIRGVFGGLDGRAVSARGAARTPRAVIVAERAG